MDKAVPWCSAPKAAAAEETEEEVTRDLARTGTTADWDAQLLPGPKLPPMMLSMEKGERARGEPLDLAACSEEVRDGLSWWG